MNSMLKKIIIAVLILHLSVLQGLCISPVKPAMSVEMVEQEVIGQFDVVRDYIYFDKTLTGYMISIRHDLMFDNCGCLTDCGKIILSKIAQIMKSSGRKWQVSCHVEDSATPINDISKSIQQAVRVTDYLTDVEKSLINQIFTIGFGSIMPDLDNKLSNRVDFVVED